MQIEVDERVVLGPILKESAEFRHFFAEEKKKVGLIHWIKVSNMPDGVEALADVSRNVIYYGKSTIFPGNAYTIAHEIMHLVRCKENSMLKIYHAQIQHGFLAMKFASMLEDPIVEQCLQEKYNFNLLIQYRCAIDYCKRVVKDEPIDDISILTNGFDLANYMLRWDLITDQDGLNEWFEYLEWYKERRPHSYKIGQDVANIIRGIGLGTIEKNQTIATLLIDKYKLQEVLFFS